MKDNFLDRIIRLLKKPNYQPLKPRVLARQLNVSDEDYPAFKKALAELQANGQLVMGSGNALSLPEAGKTLVGTYRQTSKGFGFVIPDQPYSHGDLFIPPGEQQDAVTGDRVVAEVRKRGKRGGTMAYAGRVSKILERGHSQAVGQVTRDKDTKEWFVIPDGRWLSEPIAIDDPSAKNVHVGDKVLVELLAYPDANYFAQGVVLENLGRAGEHDTELRGVIHRYNLREEFEETVMDDARAAIRRCEPSEQPGREDIRETFIITIDPAEARDFDDAISLDHLDDGSWQLGVHIADVASFVLPDSRLDQEAHTRGNSAYLPGKVLPMLPEQLSNGLCSLQEHKDRWVKSAYIHLDAEANVLGTRFANSLIRSNKRLTYEDVDTILDGRTGDHDEPVVNMVKAMETLARVIQQRRREAGMLSLELPTAELVYDDQGRVIDAHPESQTFSHTIIEMFMVEANEAVARLLDSLNVPFLRRIHEQPDAMAAEDMGRIVKLCGYTIPKDIDRKGMQQLLENAKGTSESFIINLAVLKSLQRAEYSPSPVGHFALASEHYCHFTSPIRRYPDLTIHRLLQGYLDGSLTKKTAGQFPDTAALQTLGAHCSQTERNAESAENDLKTVKLLQMLAERVGDEFNATVVSIMSFGVFVQTEQFLIEGLIRAEDVPTEQDHKKKDEKKKKPKKQKGKKGKRPMKDKQPKQAPFEKRCPYHLGQVLRIRIETVDIPGRRLDLVPAE